MADVEEMDLVKRLAAKTVFNNPANQSNMTVPQQDTPMHQNTNVGMPPELANSSFAPQHPIQPQMFPQDDGLGEYGGLPQPSIPSFDNVPQGQPARQSFQQPTNHQAVFPPDLQGTILRKLSSVEKTSLTLIEKVNSLQKQLDIWEKRIEFKDEDE